MESAVTVGVRNRAPRVEGLGVAAASGLGLAYIAFLLVMVATHNLMFGANGHPVRNDFLVFQSAGSLALHGAPLAAYSGAAIHAEEVSRAGHEFRTLFPWQYPPLFFFVAVPLAWLPFAGAFVVWVGTMVTVYGALVAATARRYTAFLLSWATPWAILATMNGQNGFLTASIVGVVLLNLERRPALSGIVLGLLSYKPQYGFLFPFALACGGYWRAFGWAGAGTLFWTVLSCAVFGVGSFMAFVHGLSHATADVLVAADIGWDKLQSIYGLARWSGASESAAWMLQICSVAGSVVAVGSLWRSRYPFALKAAGLVSLLPLVSPYAFIYDFPLLSIALAWLFRDKPFDRVEAALIALAVLCTGFFAVHSYPAGELACVAVAAIVLRRCLRLQSSNAEADPARICANRIQSVPTHLFRALNSRSPG
ncbi:MAG TPA: glycosyltransferase family 87 protein [Rhizomicrobium sp.]|jgi:hypothetical protein|nr:glycosyltransferase family 87 protein [Rhizomicrobium sp.]